MVIEALTLGCPVIATDVNGVDELIDNGRTGLIVPNEMSAMAAGLSRLLLDGGFAGAVSLCACKWSSSL